MGRVFLAEGEASTKAEGEASTKLENAQHVQKIAGRTV